MMKWSVILVLQMISGVALPKVTVVSKPSVNYVPEGGPVTLKCYVDKDGVFQYLTNALWFQNFTNGSSKPVGNTGPFAHKHSLIFHPSVREVDQGNYSCCAPGGGCSALSLIAIAVPPVIEINTNYTAFVGSRVTLACRIVYEGSPRALFRWRRHGFYVSGDHILTNDTHTMLQLTNLNEEDHGFYRCVAHGVVTFITHEVYLYIQVFPKIRIEGPALALAGITVSINCSVLEGRPSPDINITTPLGETIPRNVTMFTATSNDTGNYTCVASTSQTTVTATHYLSVTDNMGNETGTSNSSVHETSFSYFFLVDLNTTEECYSVKNKEFADQLTTALQQYIDGIHDDNIQVSVTPTLFKCVSDSIALYDVEIRGNVVIKQLQDIQTVELGIATLKNCNQSCEILTTNVVDQQQEVDDDSNDRSSNSAAVVVGSSVSVSLTIIVLICIVIVTALICIRHRNKMRQQDVVRCTEASAPSVTNTVAITEENTSSKPIQVDVHIKIGIVKTASQRDRNDTSQSFSGVDVQVVPSNTNVDIVNNNISSNLP